MIARARSLPSLTCCATSDGEPNYTGVCPASTERTAKPPPLNGTCTRSSLSDCLNNSAVGAGSNIGTEVVARASSSVPHRAEDQKNSWPQYPFQEGSVGTAAVT